MKGKIMAPATISNPVNLLDNSNFRNPINGRGAVHYTAGGYTIDRWIIWSVSGQQALTVGSGAVYWRGYMFQLLTIDRDAIYTLAIRTDDGRTVCVSGRPSQGAYYNVGNVSIGLTLYGSENYVEAYMRTLDEVQASGVVWAALYEGTYTTDTLPPYVPRPYSVELAECRRWYLPLDASKSYEATRPFRDVLRFEVLGDFARVPTLIGSIRGFGDDGVWHDLAVTSVDYRRDRTIFKLPGMDGFSTPGMTYLLTGASGVSCEL